MPDYSKWTWVEVELINKFKFYVQLEKFTGNYANLVGQHVSRINPFNEAYVKVEATPDVIKVKKVPDSSLYINFNQTIMAQRVDKKIEVIE